MKSCLSQFHEHLYFFFLIATAPQNFSCSAEILVEREFGDIRACGSPTLLSHWARLTKEAGKRDTRWNKEVLWATPLWTGTGRGACLSSTWQMVKGRLRDLRKEESWSIAGARFKPQSSHMLRCFTHVTVALCFVTQLPDTKHYEGDPTHSGQTEEGRAFQKVLKA